MICNRKSTNSLKNYMKQYEIGFNSKRSFSLTQRLLSTDLCQLTSVNCQLKTDN